MPDMPDMSSLPSLGGEGGGTEAAVNKLIESSSNDNLIMGVGAAVLLLGVLAAATSSGGDGGADGTVPTTRRRNKKPSGLEIDYQAAARLAYQTWLTNHPEAKSNPGAYEAFEALYEANAVALATAKKIARDLQAFDNTPTKPIPPRKLTMKKVVMPPPPPAKEGSGGFFFASE